ncbi:MAG TPA: HEAT repeat domain-containing protein [Myxococcales bacterium]|nr:HEAT repeat domain-containing protein [Myxococcales bacterium]
MNGVLRAEEPTEDVHRTVIFRLLDARNGFPTAKQFLRTGKPAACNRILADIVINQKEKPRYRLNAIRALEYFATPRSRSVLMEILYAKRQMPVYKRASMRALARAFGANIYMELLPFLQDLDPRVRVGAAIAMGDIDDVRIEGILFNHLPNEKDIRVRDAIEKAVRTLKERKRKKTLLKKKQSASSRDKGE